MAGPAFASKLGEGLTQEVVAVTEGGTTTLPLTFEIFSVSFVASFWASSSEIGVGVGEVWVGKGGWLLACVLLCRESPALAELGWPEEEDTEPAEPGDDTGSETGFSVEPVPLLKVKMDGGGKGWALSEEEGGRSAAAAASGGEAALEAPPGEETGPAGGVWARAELTSEAIR